MRESVAMGLQRLVAAHPQQTIAALQDWIANGSWLELSAAAETIAEPALLKDRSVALATLRLHERV